MPWVDAPTSRAPWLNLGKTATQTGAESPAQPITAGSPITWDVVYGDLPFDAAIAAWTLSAGGVYRIDMQFGGQFSGAGGVLDVDLYVGASGSDPATWTSIQNIAQPKAPRVQVLPYTAASNVFRGPASATCIYQVGAADEQMRAVIVTATSLTGVYRTLQGTGLSVQALG